MGQAWWEYPIDHGFGTLKVYDMWFETVIREPHQLAITFRLVGQMKKEDQLALLKLLRKRKGDIREIESAIRGILTRGGTEHDVGEVTWTKGRTSTGQTTAQGKYPIFDTSRKQQ